MSDREASLQDALDAVRAKGLDPESPGGAAALEYLLRRPDQGPSDPAMGTQSPTPPPSVGATKTGTQDGRSAFSTWCGVDQDRIADFFDFSGETVRLTIPAGRLPARKAEIQRVIVLLLLAAERIGFDSEATTSSRVNEIAADYAVADQNLPNNVAGSSTFISRRGKRGRHSYRITQPGLDRAGELVQQLATTDEVLS